MQGSLFSFDVFDTVLGRILLSPKDVFLLMQVRLDNIRPALPHRLMRSFWGIRVWSEFSVRNSSSKEDITLADIYRDLSKRYSLNRDQELQLTKLELDIERAVLVPMDGAVELVAEARRHGKIVFVSDMYLPSDFISQILRKFNLLRNDEQVYVSGEKGVSKRSGRLYRLVLADFGLLAPEMTHCGDNVRYDIDIPRRLGIQIHPTVEQSSPPAGWYGSACARARYAIELARARLQMVLS